MGSDVQDPQEAFGLEEHQVAERRSLQQEDQRPVILRQAGANKKVSKTWKKWMFAQPSGGAMACTKNSRTHPHVVARFKEYV